MDKINFKLCAWKGRFLTIMGRVQLINVVISSMLTYSFHVYKWPPSLLNDIAKSMRNFIWSGNWEQRKLCTVAWSTICKPRAEGGLSVRNPAEVNQASLIFLTWKLLTSEEQWAQLCRKRFLKNGKQKVHYITSSVWPGMKQYVQFVIAHSSWSVGNGHNIHFWTDRWLDSPIVDKWSIPLALFPSLQMKVSKCIVDGNWCLPEFLILRDQALVDQIQTITLPIDDIPDKLHWINSTNGDLTQKLAYSSLIGNGQQVQWAKILWNYYIPPSRAFITWTLIHNKLPTDDNLRKRGCCIVSICCFCMQQAESSQHIFFDCTVTGRLWE